VVEAGGNETLKMVTDAGAKAVFIKCDVTKWNDASAAVAKAVENLSSASANPRKSVRPSHGYAPITPLS